MDLYQKRELQKFNENLTSIAVTATASNVSLRVIGACGENKICSENPLIEVKERQSGWGSLHYNNTATVS